MFALDFLVAVAVIFFVARPIAQAISDKLRTYRQGSIEQNDLSTRVKQLESELLELKHQLTQVQESTEFVSKLIETGKKPGQIESRNKT